MYQNGFKNNKNIRNINRKTAKSIAGIIEKDSVKKQKTLEKPKMKI